MTWIGFGGGAAGGLGGRSRARGSGTARRGPIGVPIALGAINLPHTPIPRRMPSPVGRAGVRRCCTAGKSIAAPRQPGRSQRLASQRHARRAATVQPSAAQLVIFTVFFCLLQGLYNHKMPASDMGKDDDDQRQGAGENALRRVSEGVRMQTVRRQVYIYLF